MISLENLLLRLLLAALLGSIIGWERERRAWTAGLRTHMLVSLGACLAMLVSLFGFQDVTGRPGIVLDPSRVAAQVISGIGFLGAGTILLLRNEVIRGLTTAAGLWTTAAIGLAVGGGLYGAALAATTIAFIVLLAFKPLEEKYFAKHKFRVLRILLQLKEIELDAIEQLLQSYEIRFYEISLSATAQQGISQMTIHLQKNVAKQAHIVRLVQQLQALNGIKSVDLDG